MPLRVSIPAAGQMGAAIGACLAARGVEVVTSVEGRSPATATRARNAKMQIVPEAELCQADFVLSIVPPGVAVDLARRMSPRLAAMPAPPVFVDCNAVSPQTALEIDAIIAPASTFVDGSIIGPAPGVDGPMAALFVSGQAADRVLGLADHGMDIRVLDERIGSASAIKMCYGGLTKGLVALASGLMLAAERAGIGPDFRAELALSQLMLFKRFQSAIPDMYPKAYRWVAEMEEIAAFLGQDHAESAVFDAFARLYARLAEDHESADRSEIAALEAFLAPKAP